MTLHSCCVLLGKSLNSLSLLLYLLKEYNKPPLACFLRLVEAQGHHVWNCFKKYHRAPDVFVSVQLRDMGLSFPDVREAAVGADDVLSPPVFRKQEC